MRTANDRRYSLALHGRLHDPEAHNTVGAYNPRGLKKEAMKVAGAMARAHDAEVTLVKHLAKGNRDEAVFTPGWNC